MPRLAMSTPSIRIRPASWSINRNNVSMSDDLPEPVRPTIPTDMPPYSSNSFSGHLLERNDLRPCNRGPLSQLTGILRVRAAAHMRYVTCCSLLEIKAFVYAYKFLVD